MVNGKFAERANALIRLFSALLRERRDRLVLALTETYFVACSFNTNKANAEDQEFFHCRDNRVGKSRGSYRRHLPRQSRSLRHEAANTISDRSVSAIP